MASEFKTVSIKLTSRASVCIEKNYYTFEASIEKVCPPDYTLDEYNQAKADLWNEVNEEVDNQVEDIVNLCKNKK